MVIQRRSTSEVDAGQVDKRVEDFQTRQFEWQACAQRHDRFSESILWNAEENDGFWNDSDGCFVCHQTWPGFRSKAASSIAARRSRCGALTALLEMGAAPKQVRASAFGPLRLLSVVARARNHLYRTAVRWP